MQNNDDIQIIDEDDGVSNEDSRPKKFPSFGFKNVDRIYSEYVKEMGKAGHVEIYNNNELNGLEKATYFVKYAYIVIYRICSMLTQQEAIWMTKKRKPLHKNLVILKSQLLKLLDHLTGSKAVTKFSPYKMLLIVCGIMKTVDLEKIPGCFLVPEDATEEQTAIVNDSQAKCRKYAKIYKAIQILSIKHVEKAKSSMYMI